MMNKIIGAVLMAVFFSCPLSAADTYTTGDMVLIKPGKSSLNWDGKINGDLDIISSSAATKSSTQTFTGQNTFSNKVGILGPVAATYGLAISTTASISGKLTTTVASDILDWTYIGYTSTFFGSHNGAISGDDGFGFYDKSNTWNGRLDLGLIYGPQLHGKGAIGAPLLGLNTSTPKVALDVLGGIVASSSITANGNFYGNGATLSGVIQSTATGNYLLRVATATYLATAPGTCSAGQYITGLAADGTKTCETPAGAGDMLLGTAQTVTAAKTFNTSAPITASSATVSSITVNNFLTGPGIFKTASSGTLFGGGTLADTGVGTYAAACFQGSTVTFTTNGNPTLVVSNFQAMCSATADAGSLRLLIDSGAATYVLGTFTQVTNSYQSYLNTFGFMSLSAGTHTFCVQSANGGAGTTTYYSSGGYGSKQMGYTLVNFP